MSSAAANPAPGTGQTAPVSVSMWFDPVCPYTWNTARWLHEVAINRGLHVDWRPFSLQVLNNTGPEDSHAQRHAQGFRMGRMSVQARNMGHADHIFELYSGLATRFHNEQRSDFDTILTEALTQAGLPAEVRAAADDNSLDAILTEETNAVLKRVGRGVGIPLIDVNGTVFFGPVMTPRVRGPQALALWDAYVTLTQTPGVYEVKRGRRGPVDVS